MQAPDQNKEIGIIQLVVHLQAYMLAVEAFLRADDSFNGERRQVSRKGKSNIFKK